MTTSPATIVRLPSTTAAERRARIDDAMARLRRPQGTTPAAQPAAPPAAAAARDIAALLGPALDSIACRSGGTAEVAIDVEHAAADGSTTRARVVAKIATGNR